MEILLQLILTACLVNFGLTSILPNNQIANQLVTNNVNQKGKVQENFQNLFNSIANKDSEKSEVYHDILKQEKVKEQQAFDTMKDQLWIAQNRNAFKKLNFYGKNKIGGNAVLVAAKREAKEKTSEAAPSSSTTWKYEKYCDPDPTYELNQTIVEHMFRKMHPDLTKLYWKEAETMTPSRLAKICHQLLVDITPRDRDLSRYNYLTIIPATFESTRIIRKAAVFFEDDPEHPIQMTLLKCMWREMDQFIAQGDDKHVFRVDRNPDDTFEFRTGLHPVDYNVL